MLTLISQEINKGFGITFQELLGDKHFQEGKKAFQEGEFKVKGVEPKWVKSILTRSQLEGSSSYCILRKEANGYEAGFCIAKESAFPDYKECSEEDLYRIGEQRKYQNIFPNSLKDAPLGVSNKMALRDNIQEGGIEDKENFGFVFGENE